MSVSRISPFECFVSAGKVNETRPPCQEKHPVIHTQDFDFFFKTPGQKFVTFPDRICNDGKGFFRFQ